MYKLIAIDMDDTLLDSKTRISPRVSEAIRRAREKGVLVTLATGRMFSSALPFAKELELDLPLITYQGALVKNSLSGEVLYYRPVPADIARDLIQVARLWGIHVNIYINDNLYMENLSADGKAYSELARIEPVIVTDLLELLKDEPTKVLMIAPEEILDKLAEELNLRFAGRIHITKSKPYYLEFIHPLATKGFALEHLSNYYLVEREEVMAIGDSYNDLDMLEYAGLGVVMGNAREEIKAKGDYIALDNDSDGVALVLEELVLKGLKT
ncbi:MAG: Cof-type HAD-IIB family hydrolase [Desulfitobacterium hafniense]|nr:Cof-type HAD-IIB family hydrolase [Desulfitobacterium hafniense]